MATWVMSIASSTGYFGILVLMFVENVFPPIPSEVIMPLAGFMAAQGKLSLFGIILTSMAGSVLGALPLYYLGRKLGEDRLKEFTDNHGRWLTLSRKDIERAKRWCAAIERQYFSWWTVVSRQEILQSHHHT